MTQSVSTNSIIAFIMLAVLLLFHSGPADGNCSSLKTNQIVTGTGNERQTPSRLEHESDENMRMINSVIAERNQYPYMISLGIKSYYGKIFKLCGGSLITPNKILTAAHCVTEEKSTNLKDADDFQVLLGAHELSGIRNDAQLARNVVKIKIHEKYNPKNWFNDIAILTLDRPVQFTQTISPVCLPPQGTTDLYDGRLVFAKGWGHTEEGGKASDFLRHVSKRIMHHAECRQIFKPKNYADHMLCAYQPGKGTCQGDSGGPLVIQSNYSPKCKYVQVGIVSWGHGCARHGYPGVFMRVTSFLPWIKMNTQ